MSRKLTITALQKRIGSHIPITEFDRLHDQGVDLVCFPEYFFLPDGTRNQLDSAGKRQVILKLLESYSRRLAGIVVGGSLVEAEGGHFYNTCHVFDGGRPVGWYRKLHPTRHERELGITPGEQYKTFEVRGFKLGVLICADVLHPDSFQELAKLQPDLIAIPTVSPLLNDDTVERKYLRDRDLFEAGAKTAKAVVLKACGVGPLMGQPLQGRSLICSPQRIIARINPRAESLEAELTAVVDLDST